MVKKIISVIIAFLLSLMAVNPPAFAGDDPEPYTDEWIKSWYYSIEDVDSEGEYVVLKGYEGKAKDISIGGKVTINGKEYPVCIWMQKQEDSDHYFTALNGDENIRQIVFYSVDGVPVRPQLKDRLDCMFFNMKSLEGVNFGDDFLTSGVTSAREMFYGCNNLNFVDVNNLDLDNCKDFGYMFNQCGKLNRITVNCPLAANTEAMFSDCVGLTEVTLNGGSKKLDHADSMFCGCSSLEKVTLNDLDFSDVEDFSHMFNGCGSLKSVDLSKIDFSSATDLSSMFYDCGKMESIDLTSAEWGNSTPSSQMMFYNCKNLKEITVDENFRPSEAAEMFYVPEEDLSLLTIKGKPSKEFAENVFPGLVYSNRYIGEVELKSKIELEGKELEGGMFCIEYLNDRKVIYDINHEYNDQIISLTVPVYYPGTNTFTVEEKYADQYRSYYESYKPISETEDYTCEDSWRTKTVNIVLNEDGSLSVEG